jgi:hypothetical protein
MPQINVTLNVSKKALMSLLGSRTTTVMQAKIPVNSKAATVAAPTTTTTQRTPLTPVENPTQYLRTPGTPSGTTGRPFKLNADGLKLVNRFSKQGYNPTEISTAFGGIVGPESIRRFVSAVNSNS